MLAGCAGLLFTCAISEFQHHQNAGSIQSEFIHVALENKEKGHSWVSLSCFFELSHAFYKRVSKEMHAKQGGDQQLLTTAIKDNRFKQYGIACA